MEAEEEFLHWLELTQAGTVRFVDLPMLVAAAQFPGDTGHAALRRAGAAINIEKRLKELADSGALAVRDPLSKKRIDGASGHALRDAVLIPEVDLAPHCEAFAIGLRFIPPNTGPTHWTIGSAAAAIAAQEGWHAGACDTLRDQMMQAARAGALTVRHPQTGLAYRPEKLRDYYELVTPTDVNAWFALDPVACLHWKAEAKPADADVHLSEPAAPLSTHLALVADPDQLLQAFKPFLKREWFKNLSDRKWLRGARRYPGKSGRGGAPALFCPYTVMLGLMNSIQKKRLPQAAGRHRLREHFPKVFAEHEHERPGQRAGEA